MSKSSNPRQIQLTEGLLNKETSGPNILKSKINAQWFKKLFIQESVRDYDSNKEIEKLGGYKGLQEILKTSCKDGIPSTQNDKKERIKKYGKNIPFVKDPMTLWDMILQNFEDQCIRILCFAAVASLILGVATHGWGQGWLEGVSILIAVVIITVVTSGNNYMKEQQFRKLNEAAKKKDVNVTRNGQVIRLNVLDVLVGDLLQIETGEILSVDGIVVKSNRFRTDQSAMTGQTDTIKKQVFENNANTNCFLISGTRVVEGTGMMIVLCVGHNTVQNMLKSKLITEDDETPLQEKLAVLADQIGMVGMYAASLTFLALLFHLLWATMKGQHQLFSIEVANSLVEYFIIAVSILVLAVPEGLPLAVTIALAYSVGKMKDQNNLVRYLAACQTMGGANNICSDKTGTLTKNQMTVTKLWAQNNILDKFDAEDKILHDNFKFLLANAISLNSDAQPKLKKNKFQQNGNKTQCALLQLMFKYGYNFSQIRKSQEVINVIPFSSARKRMSSICKLSKSNKYYIFSKGAPEILINYCNRYVDKSNQIVPINDKFKEELALNITAFAHQSLRTLLICYEEIPKDIVNTADPEKLENNFIVLCLAGIKDPLKESVPESVLNCKKAGIIVRMVTGDNSETAIAIAKDAHIIPTDYQRPAKGNPGYYVAMEGKEFRTLVEGLYKESEQPDAKEFVKNIDVFKEITDELRVLARSSPEDKYILATGLKQLNNVVAMTGDGTNDAPALKKADIGFAMGQAGTQVAKQAAGIILLDDNFSSIITAVKYGRNIFDCIRKFLQFQLTVNLVAIFMAFMGAAVLKQSPLTPVQMLWVNLIMDTLAALALATDPPSPELLKRMPYPRTQYIINFQMWRNIVVNAIYQIIVLSIILFNGAEIFGVESSIGVTKETWNATNGVHFTIFFNIFVFLQVFNFLNARKLKVEELNVFQNFFDNNLFLIIVAAIFLCQIFIVQFGGKSFALVPLSMHQHFVCIIYGATMLGWAYLAKKFIPDSLFNNFELLKQGQVNANYNVDSIFEKYYQHPATERRKSKQRNSRKSEKKP